VGLTQQTGEKTHSLKYFRENLFKIIHFQNILSLKFSHQHKKKGDQKIQFWPKNKEIRYAVGLLYLLLS